jgi:hypothetical protein
MYLCDKCNKEFSRKDNMLRHLKSIHRPKKIQMLSNNQGNLRYLHNLLMHSDSINEREDLQLSSLQNKDLINYETLNNQDNVEDDTFTKLIPLFDRKFDSFDYKLKSPFSMVISGMPQSGKSTLVKKLLERRNEMIYTGNKGPISRILYCFTEYQPQFFADLKQKIPEIKFHEGLPQNYYDGTDNPSIIVLDDLMNEASKSDDVCNVFSRTSHHRNICLIMLVQNFFHRNLRKLTTCCQYLCIMKNPRDSSFVSCIGRQMNGGKKNTALESAYKDSSSKPYGYIFIDCSQQQNDKYRIRDNIFPEFCTLYTE